MNTKSSIVAVLQKFGCGREPRIKAITTDIGVNTIDSIVKMEKPVIKEIKRILVIIVDSNATAASWGDD